MGQHFWGFSKSQTPRRWLLSIRILFVLKSDKNDEVTAPKEGRENARGKNDPNLPITLPNFNIFK